MTRLIIAASLIVKAILASLALVVLVFTLEARAISLEDQAPSKNVEVEQSSRCPNPDNSLEYVQVTVSKMALKPGWEKLRSIFLISPSMVSEVRQLFLLMPTVSMAPRLREVVETETEMIMIVYSPDKPRSIFVFVDKNDCVITSGPLDREPTSAMLDVLEIPH